MMTVVICCKRHGLPDFMLKQKEPDQVVESQFVDKWGSI